MKKNFIGLISYVMLLVSACNVTQSVDPTATLEVEADSPYRIALVMKTLTNPFFVEMERGARRAEEEFGVDLIVRTAAQETSIEQQIQIVSDLIRDEVDAIVIAPCDSLGLIPVLAQAHEAGIVVINIDNRLAPDFAETQGLMDVPFISVDNEEAAYQSANFISQQITSPTEVLIFEGFAEAQNAQDRLVGALRAFSENANITVVAQASANWKIDEAYTLSEELFGEYPNVGAVFAANDMMALGVIQYLSEIERNDVLIAAFDAIQEAEEALVNGSLRVTIDQQAAEQGYLGVDYAIRALNGEELPSETMVDFELISTDTLD